MEGRERAEMTKARIQVAPRVSEVRVLFLLPLVGGILGASWILLDESGDFFQPILLLMVGLVIWGMFRLLSMWRRTRILIDEEACEWRSRWRPPFGRRPVVFYWTEVLHVEPERVFPRCYPWRDGGLVVHLYRDPSAERKSGGLPHAIHLPSRLWRASSLVTMLKSKLTLAQFPPELLNAPAVTKLRANLSSLLLFVASTYLALILLAPELHLFRLQVLSLPQALIMVLLGVGAILLSGYQPVAAAAFVAGFMGALGTLLTVRFHDVCLIGDVRWIPAWIGALSATCLGAAAVIFFRRQICRAWEVLAILVLSIIGFSFGWNLYGPVTGWEFGGALSFGPQFQYAHGMDNEPWTPDGRFFLVSDPCFSWWDRHRNRELGEFQQGGCVWFDTHARPVWRVAVRHLDIFAVGNQGAMGGDAAGSYVYVRRNAMTDAVREYDLWPLYGPGGSVSIDRRSFSLIRVIGPDWNHAKYRCVAIDLDSGEVRNLPFPELPCCTAKLYGLTAGRWLYLTQEEEPPEMRGMPRSASNPGPSPCKLWYVDETKSAPAKVIFEEGRIETIYAQVLTPEALYLALEPNAESWLRIDWVADPPTLRTVKKFTTVPATRTLSKPRFTVKTFLLWDSVYQVRVSDAITRQEYRLPNGGRPDPYYDGYLPVSWYEGVLWSPTGNQALFVSASSLDPFTDYVQKVHYAIDSRWIDSHTHFAPCKGVTYVDFDALATKTRANGAYRPMPVEYTARQ